MSNGPPSSEENEGSARRMLDERLHFETLLAELSAGFINLPADQVDATVEEAQRRVCECLGLDLAVLWQWEYDKPGTFTLTHHYRRLDGPPISSQLQASELWPWSLRQVQAGKSIVISSTEDDIPEGAERDQESWQYFGLKSILIIPLSTGGEAPFGAITFHDMATPRTWSEALVRRLELVAQIFANTIARKRIEQVLRESAERLNLAAESAGAGLWSLDLATGRFWTTDQVRETFGFGPDEEVTLDRVLEATLPEDRASIRQALDEVVATGALGRVEYRVVRPDGSIRWLASRGRLQREPGHPSYVMGVTMDVTELKLAQESLKQGEFRMASAVDIAGLGFYEVANGEDVTFLDSRAADLVGLSGKPTLGAAALQFWMEHLAPEDRPRILELHQKLNAGDLEQITVEFPYSHPQRGPIWLQLLSHVIERDDAGHALRTIGVFRDITSQKMAEQKLSQALDEVRTLRDQLQNENLYLREQIRSDAGHGSIVGASESMKHMLGLARKVAPTASVVLITGETGTGKELLAQAIHDLSSRRRKLMVKVNCAALPAPLIESELFGREKGAYTGAMTQQVGRFEVANGSTIFLDEIGDLPLDLQVKLLRVLQDGQYERLGSPHPMKADVRVIAATNRDLAAMMREGRFREDLFHRLNVFAIETPPLRERPDDIPLLAWTFVQEFNVKMGRLIEAIPRVTMERLKQYRWPGNVRELRNVIERSMIVSDGRSLKVELPESASLIASHPCTLEEVERKHIVEVLERTHWHISGKGGAAEILGLVSTTLHSRMKKLGITRPLH